MIGQKIRVSEIIKDLRAQMSDADLQEKYRLTPQALRYVLAQSVEAGLINVMEMLERTSISESDVMRAFGESDDHVLRCRDCGQILSEQDQQCSHCAELVRNLRDILIMSNCSDEDQPSARRGNQTLNQPVDSGNESVGANGPHAISDNGGTRFTSENGFQLEDRATICPPTTAVDISTRSTDRDIRENLRAKALLKASRNCDVERVRKLLSQGIDANAKSKSGNTALILSAYKGCQEIAKLLLEKGADLNVCNFQGNSALFFACVAGHESLAEWLLIHGADPNIRNNDGNTPLMVLCLEDNPDLVLSFLLRGAQVNTVNNNGDTPLMKASEKGCPKVVRILLEAGAILDSKNKHGNTALMKAALNSHTDVVKLLLQWGADPNAKNFYNNTALMKACYRGSISVAKLLLEFGADVGVVDYEGKTALSRAEHSGRQELVDLIARSRN